MPYKDAEAQKKYFKEYYSRPEIQEKRKKYLKKWCKNNRSLKQKDTATYREKHPEKTRAHWAVGNALRSGTLIKCPCEVCGDENSQAHHEDYSRPLEVRWFCDHHHKDHEGRLLVPGRVSRCSIHRGRKKE